MARLLIGLVALQLALQAAVLLAASRLLTTGWEDGRGEDLLAAEAADRYVRQIRI